LDHYFLRSYLFDRDFDGLIISKRGFVAQIVQPIHQVDCLCRDSAKYKVESGKYKDSDYYFLYIFHVGSEKN